MRRLFADAFYWVALCNRKDQWHARVAHFSGTLAGCQIVTIDEVLVEVLAHFSAAGPTLREYMARFVRNLLVDPDTSVLPQSRQSFLTGLALYQARRDKTYSLTDCISMEAMRREGIAEILTRDQHFGQEGFTVLF